jgi:nickel/cobalt transporter (NicO) family protein
MLASPLLLGLLLGVRHAADADHVATIATVVVGRTNLLGAIRTAILWGAGHSLTFFAVGLGIVLFGLHVPPEFETGVEVAIALSLLILGGIQLLRGRQNQLAQRDPHASRPLLLGSLHGLAGSAGIALLALAAIQTKHEALLYLLLFALGTMAGMAVITFFLAWSFRISASLSWVRRSLIVAAGLVSCLCGLSILGELWT